MAPLDERFGLTAAVFSADEDVAMRVFKKLGGSVGTVYWNACGEMAATLPWSGRKQSGMGCTSGAHGLYSFLRPRSMVLRSPPVAGPLEKHPRLHGAAPLHDRHTGQQPRRAHRSDDYTITTHHRDDHNKEEDPGRR